MSAGSVCLAANKFLYLTKVEHVLADLGHPLPTFWSALPNASVHLSKLSFPLQDYILDGNHV